MSRAKTNMITKRIVDTAMTVLLLFLMAFQVTGEMVHEWIGMGMSGYAVPFFYVKAGGLVFLENLLILSFWAFIGIRAALLCRSAGGKAEKKKNLLIPAAAIVASVIIGVVLILLFPSAGGRMPFKNADWSARQLS